MPDMLRVSTKDRKYTVVQDESGKLTALRYGEPWRDCVGDGLILHLAQELDKYKSALIDVLALHSTASPGLNIFEADTVSDAIAIARKALEP